MPQEVVTIHTGQTGCGFAHSVWELLTGEHDINCDGTPKKTFEKYTKHDECTTFTGQNFFYETPRNMIIPRVIISDTEDVVINEIKSGYYKNLFHPNRLINNFEDAASIFGRGYWNLGVLQLQKFYEAMRSEVELCDTLSCFLMIHSINGGTGSGYGALQLEELNDMFSKATKVQIEVFPSEMFQTNMVETYNAVLAHHYNSNIVDCAFVLDNEALFSVCCKYNKIARPTYLNINRMASQFISSLTASQRFGGMLSGSLPAYLTNIIPYPRIHYPVCSYSPIFTRHEANYEMNENIDFMTETLFDNDHQFCRIDVNTGSFMSASLTYRGPIDTCKIYQCVNKLKGSHLKFTEWSPCEFKMTLCPQPMTVVSRTNLCVSPRSVTLMSNTSSVSKKFKGVLYRCKQLFQKKSFLHWFVAENTEEQEFQDSFEDVASLINDYMVCCQEKGDNFEMDNFCKERAKLGLVEALEKSIDLNIDRAKTIIFRALGGNTKSEESNIEQTEIEPESKDTEISQVDSDDRNDKQMTEEVEVVELTITQEDDEEAGEETTEDD